MLFYYNEINYLKIGYTQKTPISDNAYLRKRLSQKTPISENAYLRKRLSQKTPISENAFLLKCLPVVKAKCSEIKIYTFIYFKLGKQ